MPAVSPSAASRPALRGLKPLPATLLNVAEVAVTLGVCRATVYALCDCGELAHVRVSNAIRFTRADLERFLATGRR
jgi:excisionase family DNA binding protein